LIVLVFYIIITSIVCLVTFSVVLINLKRMTRYSPREKNEKLILIKLEHPNWEISLFHENYPAKQMADFLLLASCYLYNNNYFFLYTSSVSFINTKSIYSFPLSYTMYTNKWGNNVPYVLFKVNISIDIFCSYRKNYIKEKIRREWCLVLIVWINNYFLVFCVWH